MEAQVRTVSIITPTWGRHDLLLNRCIPSVQAQDYPAVEHVIVSDGPDYELAAKISSLAPGRHHIWFYQIPVREGGRYGSRARRYGIERATGELIGYNDDDDMLYPGHVSKLVAAMEAKPDAGFARSFMDQIHAGGSRNTVGHGNLAYGNLGTPMVLHKREVLEIANWGVNSGAEDWELFSRWINAGVPWAAVNEVTVDVWPSAYHPGQYGDGPPPTRKVGV